MNSDPHLWVLLEISVETNESIAAIFCLLSEGGKDYFIVTLPQIFVRHSERSFVLCQDFLEMLSSVYNGLSNTKIALLAAMW